MRSQNIFCTEKQYNYFAIIINDNSGVIISDRKALVVASDLVNPFIYSSELQTRWVSEDNSTFFFFLFLNENVCCDPSLETSRKDGSNDRSQHIFLCFHMENHT